MSIEPSLLVKESIFCGLHQCISFWSNKKSMSEESPSEWEHLVKKEVELKFNTFKAKYDKLKTDNNMLHIDGIKYSLEELQ